MADRLMTLGELAAYLAVPVKTVYAWRYRGAGPPGLRVGRFVRFRPEDVETWLASRRAEADRSGP